MNPIYVGCASWTIPKAHAGHFPASGSHLERYAARFSAVEINSSFYRPHRPATYTRWAASVSEDFRFAVKAPRQVTHNGRLTDLETLGRFLSEVNALGDKLGPMLVQLPPSLAFDARVARVFLKALRERFAGHVVCEPRHQSWFASEADQLLIEFQVARAAADPALTPGADRPGGWGGLAYFRLHGSPRMYYSAYSVERLGALTCVLQEAARVASVWCIFNNTAQGAATQDALVLLEQLKCGYSDNVLE